MIGYLMKTLPCILWGCNFSKEINFYALMKTALTVYVPKIKLKMGLNPLVKRLD
jgi:hypothetical protein